MFDVWPACDAIKVLEDLLWAKHCSLHRMQSCVPHMGWRMAHATAYLASLLVQIPLHCTILSASIRWKGLPIVRIIGPLALLWDGSACQVGCPCSTSRRPARVIGPTNNWLWCKMAVLARLVVCVQQAVTSCKGYWSDQQLALVWDGIACQVACPCSASSDGWQGLLAHWLCCGMAVLAGWLSWFSKHSRLARTCTQSRGEIKMELTPVIQVCAPVIQVCAQEGACMHTAPQGPVSQDPRHSAWAHICVQCRRYRLRRDDGLLPVLFDMLVLLDTGTCFRSMFSV